MNAPKNRTKIKTNPLHNTGTRMLAAGAATLLALSVANADTSAPDYAADKDPANNGPSTISKRMFEQLDKDKNNRLDWSELHTTYAAQLERLEWTENSVFMNFDRNQNRALDLDEYTDFLAGIRTESLQPRDTVSRAPNTLISPPPEMENQGSAIRIAQNSPHYSTLKDQPVEDKPSDSTTTMQQRDPQDSSQSSTQSNSNDQRVYRDMKTDGLSGKEPYAEKSVPAEEAKPEKKSPLNPKTVVLDGKNIETDAIEGAEVKNLNNQNIGVVDKVITAQNGAAAGLIINVGGALGVGEKEVFVSISKLKMKGDQIVWQTRMDQDAVRDLPTYDDSLISYTYQ